MSPIQIKSFLTLIAITLALSSYQLLNPGNFDYINLTVGIALSIGGYLVIVYFLKILRSNAEELTVLGYVWRSILTKYASLIVSVVLLTFFSDSFVIPSIGYTFISNIVITIVSINLAWLFFSTDRKGQLKWVTTIFNGY